MMNYVALRSMQSKINCAVQPVDSVEPVQSDYQSSHCQSYAGFLLSDFIRIRPIVGKKSTHFTGWAADQHTLLPRNPTLANPPE